jgi:hypothetical protein
VFPLEHAAVDPHFFGPEDPAIYFQMRCDVLHDGIIVQDFIHHCLSHPSHLEHIEDYYEPAFGILVSGARRLGGNMSAIALANAAFS